MILKCRNRDDISSLRHFKGCLSGNGGFTIIELVVVVVIVAILAAVTGPMVRQWNRNKELSGTARHVFADLQLAKLEAIRNNCDVVALFNAGDYEVFLDNGGPSEGDGPQNQIKNTTETMVVQTSTPEGVAIIKDGFGGVDWTGFNSRALPLSGAGSVVIRRSGSTDRWYRVRMTASGKLKLEKSTDSTDGSDGTWN